MSLLERAIRWRESTLSAVPARRAGHENASAAEREEADREVEAALRRELTALRALPVSASDDAVRATLGLSVSS